MKIQVGQWIVDTDVLEANWGDAYPIDLEARQTCAQILDMLAQVSRKTWGTPAVVGDLLKIFDAALLLQETMCSWGVDHRSTAPAALIRHNLIQFEVNRRCVPFPDDGNVAEIVEYWEREQNRVRREMGIA